MSRKPSLTQPETRRFDSLEQEVFLNLWRTYDRLKGIEDELFSQFDVSAQQYNTLRLLRTVAPEAIQTLALGKLLISQAPDMTRLLDRLETHGWIVRNRLPLNRRVVEVAISGAGLEFLSRVDSAVREMHERQVGHLAIREQRELVRLLKLTRLPHEDNDHGWLND